MASKANGHASLQFGTYEVDLASQEVFRRGVPLHLHGKPFRILALLLERPGDIFTREELQQRLWPDGTFVDFDRNLNTSVKRLRQALGDSAEAPVFIETIPRRGYRFIAPVNFGGNGSSEVATAAAPNGASSVTNGQATHPAISARTLAWIAVAVVCAAAAVVVAVKLASRDNSLDVRKMRISKVTESGNIREMAISPDGEYLAYAIDQGVEQSLWVRALNGTNAVQVLAPDTVNFAGISFSPDGSFLYFARSEKTNPSFGYLCRMRAMGGKVEELIRDADSPPSFSPDGNRFAYTRGYPPRNATQVRVADNDGTHDHALIELAGHQVFEAGATWSPDGARIAVPIHIIGDQSKFVLYIISLSDGKARGLFSSEGIIGRPLWLSNNQLLAALQAGNSMGAQLWTISYPDGVAERFTNDLSDYSAAIDFSRDRKRLAAITNSLVSNLWAAASGDLPHPAQLTSGGPAVLQIRELRDEIQEGRLVMLATGLDPLTHVLPDGHSVPQETALWTMNADGSHRVRCRGWKNPSGLNPAAPVCWFQRIGRAIQSCCVMKMTARLAKL